LLIALFCFPVSLPRWSSSSGGGEGHLRFEAALDVGVVVGVVVDATCGFIAEDALFEGFGRHVDLWGDEISGGCAGEMGRGEWKSGPWSGGCRPLCMGVRLL
jgi:hypothetical protein